MISGYMRQIKLIWILNLAVATGCGPAYAQTAATGNQPSISKTVEQFDTILEGAERFRQRTTRPPAQRSITPVLLAIPKFRQATADFRDAVGAQQNTRVPLQSLERLIKPFTEYFKDLKLKSSAPDIQELKTYSPKELVWETLTTAERVDNNLQIANRLLRESNQSGAVSIKTLQFYAEIDSDLKRLKWLVDKVAAQR
jgi:hypothetical protein